MLLSSIMFLINEFFEYQKGYIDSLEAVLLVIVLGMNFIFSIGAGLISNKFKRQKLELERAYRQLESHQKDMDDIFNSLDTTIWYLDLSTMALRMSSGVEKITGFTQKDFQEDHCVWIQFVHPEDQQNLKEHFALVRKGNASECQFRIITRNGSTKWIESRAKPVFDQHDIVIKIQGVISDITERQKEYGSPISVNGGKYDRPGWNCRSERGIQIRFPFSRGLVRI